MRPSERSFSSSLSQKFAPLARLRTRDETTSHRPDRRVRLRGRRAHLLSGAHRQRSPICARRPSASRCRNSAARRLPPATRRGRRNLARLCAGNAADAAGRAAARAGQFRHRPAARHQARRRAKVQSVPVPLCLSVAERPRLSRPSQQPAVCHCARGAATGVIVQLCVPLGRACVSIAKLLNDR